MRRLIIGGAAIVALTALHTAAEAQQRPRRQQPIEIRGTVPTPQVVTIRPREVPTYDRRVLVPTFYDHDFWQSILPGYLLVRQRMITGAVPGDTIGVRRDSTGVITPATATRDGVVLPDTGAPPAANRPPGAPPPTGTPPTAAPPAGSSPPPVVPPPAGAQPPPGAAGSTTTPPPPIAWDGTPRAIPMVGGARRTPVRDDSR
jgi:hypothetical protein